MATIAHILPWNGVGGTEHATVRIARAVSDRHESILYYPASAPEVEAFVRGSGFEAIPYEQVEPSFKFPLPYVVASIRLARSFRRNGVRIAHCADWTGVQYAALAARLARCRLISHVRNRNEKIAKRDWRLLRLVDRFVFVSRQTADGFGFPCAPDRATVLYDGISPPSQSASARELRETFNLPDDARLVGMSARVAEQKDFPTLIEAAAALLSRHPSMRILIFGDYERQPAHREHYGLVRDALRRHGVEEAFCFAGFREDAVRLLGGLEIFVLSTHWEGLPLVILEAMSHGLPVVATAVDGIPELVEEGVTGLLVPHADGSALAEALGRLLDDRELAERMGANGRQRVLEGFGVERFAERLRSLYGRDD